MSNLSNPFAKRSISAAQQTVTSDDVDAAAASQALFGNLLPLSWRGVGIPYVDFKVSLRQDLAVHKFSNLDGADVEPTGRSPLEFVARVPFLNHIQPAPSELWSSGNLYPNQFRLFFAACVNRSPAYLQHPEFGRIYCVVSHLDVDWKASTRDGVYVDVTWIETFEPNGSVSPNITGAGQVSAASQAGVDLDTLLPTLPQSSFPLLPPNSTSFSDFFSDFARGLQGVADQTSLLQYQTGGKIDAIMSQVQTTLNAFSQATHNQTDASNSVQSWPTRDACDRYLAALATIKQNLLSTGQKVHLYVPKADTSLPMLALTIPASISDLMNLNPALIFELVVPAYSQVRYYQGSTNVPSSGLGA